MDIVKPIIRHVLFPLQEFLKGHKTLSCLRDLEKSQSFDKEKLYELQSEKLRQLVDYACRNVPYYRKLFDVHKIVPESIQTPSDLQKLPLLTKEIIRGEMENLKSRETENLETFNTGGSTGAPLIFYIGKRRVSMDVAAKLRATRWWDVDIGDSEIVLWGSPVELNRQDFARQMRDALFRTRLLSAFDLGEQKIDEYLGTIRKYRPKHVFGYPSSISVLSMYAKQKNVRLDDLGVRVVFCTAEKLYDHQREIISQVFNAPVANGYGGRDSGFIAHECPEAQGMHITAESIILEIIDQDGNALAPGQKGEIVITHLDTHEFPFIRYKTGDIGVLADNACSCGRGLPLLKEIDGRATDFIVTRDGRIMHGLSLIYVMREISGIEEFKIIQEDLDHFTVTIVRNSFFKSDSETAIRSGFEQRIGGNIKIDFDYVPRIESEKSGKFRYVVSKVPLTDQSSYAGSNVNYV